ncbi:MULTISPECIES: LysR family transcriptional regulator [unclassified Neisseria]|uniref:LysR family transcriptional regulator n=1 Tax=unclassified Neisseria TaxID=2623750 RepID=UPI00107244B9|nr:MULTISPECIES: LysR family transcriptional regulator [unclassified Neisseria]MBF0804741.1 LysR family transcriptional regulator [Neisseria sp. 19428wB4_WF04]TFU40232.1 LysR family transcriptional regulator [Neisseria sp. WF04]
MGNVDLNDIRLFVAVVQAGSFSKAADLANIPKSRLSRRISRLEAGLGTALMDRSRRGVLLNEVGEQFYLRAQQMMQAAEAAVNGVQGRLDTPGGLLRISVSTEVGRGFLMLHLAEYMRRYPDVVLEVEINNKKVNMIQDGIDIALRLSLPEDGNVVARKLTDIELGLFAAESYLQRAGCPKSPHELHGHTLLNKYDGPEWRFVCRQHSVHIQGSCKLSSNDANLLGQMVSDGIGIALLPCFDNMLRSGWVRLLPQWRVDTVPLYLVYYKNRGSTPNVASMVDFLLEKSGRR